MNTEEKTQKMSVYFPQDLLEQVRTSAKEHKRSFNKEVLWLIEQGLKHESRKKERQ